MARTKRALSHASETSAKKRKVDNASEELLPFIHMKNDLKSKLEFELKEYSSQYSKPRKTPPADPEVELERIHKRIREDISDVNKQLDENWPNNQNFDLEIQLVVKTVAFAILNSVHTEWDITRFADKVKNTKVDKNKESLEDLTLPIYFPQARFGKLTDPATILDLHGKVMVWALPGVLHPKRMKDYHKAIRDLDQVLIKCRKKKEKKKQDKTNWRENNFIPLPNSIFEHGIVDFSPGWFAQRRERLVDPIVVSTEYRTESAAKFIKHILHAEAILNCIGMLICPELFSAGAKAIRKLKNGEHLNKWYDNVKLWPSFFSGLEVISNRTTLVHRDSQSAPAMYDFLVSAGNHKGTWFTLPDIKTKLSYEPGTVTAICGRVLRHGVIKWQNDTNRLCIAHFIRDRVHERLSIPRPDWVTDVQYLEMMDRNFLKRQDWVVDEAVDEDDI